MTSLFHISRRHPRGNVREEVGQTNLEFGKEIRARDMNLEVIGIYIPLKARERDEIIKEEENQGTLLHEPQRRERSSKGDWERACCEVEGNPGECGVLETRCR